MGVPAIATDINGCNEIIEPASTGLLVRSKSTAELATAMQALAPDPARRAAMGNAARASVVRRYDQGPFWQKLDRYYRDVLVGDR